MTFSIYRQTFLTELDVLSRIKHINISCLYGVQLDLLYLVQEHSPFGTLQDYFHTLSNQQTNDSTFQKYNHLDISMLILLVMFILG